MCSKIKRCSFINKICSCLIFNGFSWLDAKQIFFSVYKMAFQRPILQDQEHSAQDNSGQKWRTEELASSAFGNFIVYATFLRLGTLAQETRQFSR